MTGDDWITVPHWERFQHYGLSRRPNWIKNYLGLLDKDEYVDLTFSERGILHGIWLAYAARNGHLRVRDLGPALGVQPRPKPRPLSSLNHAGLILLSSSRPLSLIQKEKDSLDQTTEVDPTLKQRRRAEAWIRNGAAAQVPRNDLPAVLADEFKLDDALVAQLVIYAEEWQS